MSMFSDADDHPEVHPAVEGVAKDDDVRLRIDETGDDTYFGTVEKAKCERDDMGGFVLVVVREEGNHGDVFDLQAEFDPRDGWTDLRAARRLYPDPHEDENQETEWSDENPVEELAVIDIGVHPMALDTPGIDVEHKGGDMYRVVVPPHEYDYGEKALAYNLDSKGNTLEKLEPDDVVNDGLSPEEVVEDGE